MAYSDFNLSTIKKQFDLNLIEKLELFNTINELKPSVLLT
jgi:hypothetical protein